MEVFSPTGISNVTANVYHLHGLFRKCILVGGKIAPALGAQEHWVFKAIFTDSHFWIPFVVLLLGIGLLIFLR